MNAEQIAAILRVPISRLKPYKRLIAEGRIAGQCKLKIALHQVAWRGENPGIMKFLAINELGFAEDPVLAEQRRVETEIKKANYDNAVRERGGGLDVDLPDARDLTRLSDGSVARADMEDLTRQEEAMDAEQNAATEGGRP